MQMSALLQQYSRNAIKRKRDDVKGNNSNNNNNNADDVNTTTLPMTTTTTTTTTTDVNELPHFLIIGAQKAGTMAAVKNLNKHPDINVVSEEHYFDLGWFQKSKKNYIDLFKQSPKPIQGEKTPELIYVDECALRIKEVCPNAKFILFLRDPVKRAFSSWNMNRSKSRESEPFDLCVERNLQSLNEYRSYGTAEYHYVQRGFYLDQIERFLKVFPDRSKFLIVVAENIRKDPAAEYNKIFEFLGAKGFAFEAEDEHVGSYETKLSPQVARKLRNVYKAHNERLFKFLGYRIPEWEAPIVDNQDHVDHVDPVDPVGPPVISSVKKVEAASIDIVGVDNVGVDCVKSQADFAKIGRHHGTDKVTHHGYHRFYPRFLEHYRSMTGGAMLEIGIDQQKSLQTWIDYFPNAFIYGIDIGVAASGPRHKIFRADQSSVSDLQNIATNEIKHPVFFIIDDGSHIPEHQVLSFDYLFSNVLMSGGTYIIEDIEVSYWTKNGLYGYRTSYGYHHNKSVMEVFKDLLDDINHEFLTADAKNAQDRRLGSDLSIKTRAAVSSITFGQNCIIIVKKTPEEDMYSNRKYRFNKNL